MNRRNFLKVLAGGAAIALVPLSLLPAPVDVYSTTVTLGNFVEGDTLYLGFTKPFHMIKVIKPISQPSLIWERWDAQEEQWLALTK